VSSERSLAGTGTPSRPLLLDPYDLGESARVCGLTREGLRTQRRKSRQYAGMKLMVRSAERDFHGAGRRLIADLEAGDDEYSAAQLAYVRHLLETYKNRKEFEASLQPELG
jgi:hypothetical protein